MSKLKTRKHFTKRSYLLTYANALTNIETLYFTTFTNLNVDVNTMIIFILDHSVLTNIKRYTFGI